MRNDTIAINADITAIIFGINTVLGVTLIANPENVGISSMASNAMVNAVATGGEGEGREEEKKEEGKKSTHERVGLFVFLSFFFI